MSAEFEIKEARIFKERLRLLREESGENTDAEFADKAGISRQTMWCYLNGQRKPDFPTLIKLCKAFSVSSDWLLGLTDVRSPKMETRSIVDSTGLSEKAVDGIFNLSLLGQIDALSDLLESQNFLMIMSYIHDFLDVDTYPHLVSLSDWSDLKEYKCDAAFRAFLKQIRSKTVNRRIEERKKREGILSNEVLNYFDLRSHEDGQH